MNGVPNKVYSQGVEGRDMWEEVLRFFRKHADQKIFNNATKFYAEKKFGLFIDLRSMSDNKMHGSGLRLVNTKDGVNLEIQRTTSGSGNVKCYIFAIADAQFSIANKELQSVQY